MHAMQKLFTENAVDSDVILEKSIEFGRDYLGGEWKEVEKSRVKVTQIKGGQSNLLFHVTSSGNKSFLIRIHRQPQSQVFQDTVNFAIFSERGLGPKLYGFFEGGRLEEFLPSKTIGEDELLEPVTSVKIASILPAYHAVEMPISKKPMLFQTMREWLNDYKALGGGDYFIKPRTVTYSEHPEKVSVEDISNELDTFEEWAHALFPDTVVYCNNDLSCGNMLELNSSGSIVLIDWEFSSYNWRGFDIAMHLAETAIDYRIPVAPWVAFSEQLTDAPPNLTLFADAYLDAHAKMHGYTRSDAHLDRLLHEIRFFWPLTHLFWAIWSMKNSLLKMECGVDLDVCATDRLAIYFHLKPKSENIYKHLFGAK